MGGTSCTISCHACEQASVIHQRTTDVDMADNLAVHRDILAHHVPEIFEYEDFQVVINTEVEYYEFRAEQSTSTLH